MHLEDLLPVSQNVSKRVEKEGGESGEEGGVTGEKEGG